MVLNGDCVPLNLGRKQRLHDTYQRIALHHRYKGCAAINCDRPPAWTEIHHPHAWADGGRTDLANGLPLCPPHHHMADHPDSWNMTPAAQRRRQLLPTPIGIGERLSRPHPLGCSEVDWYPFRTGCRGRRLQ